MSLWQDIAFCLKPRCPVCRKGKLFKPHSITVADECPECGEKLGAHDIGDGASVFFIFLFGFTVIPMAWGFELMFAPPLWVHGVLWTIVMLAVILTLLPAVKCFIILLEWRHRKK